MSHSKLRRLFGILLATLCVLAIPLQSHAAPKGKHQATQAAKEHLVLMPLRLGEQDQQLQGAMETALLEGLQQKYEVFTGDKVDQRRREVFAKESQKGKTDCDETKCLQEIAATFNSELLAVVNVTKQSDGYFLAINIRNLWDDKVIYSKSVPCKGCDAYAVVDKLKELVGTSAPLVTAIEETPQAKVNLSDSETALWEEAKKGNAVEDYQAYLSQYPKGKYIALAKTKLARMKDEARAETEKQEQQSWNDAQQSASQDSYNAYLSLYPKGRFAALAQARIAKLKKEETDAETKQRREQLAEEAKQKREQAAEAARQKQEQAATTERKTREATKSYVSQGGVTWMPINTSTKTWSDANNYCQTTTINGQTGWRLPTRDELKSLYASGAMKDLGVPLDDTWSSTEYREEHVYGSIYCVDLHNGHSNPYDYKTDHYMTCVR